MFIVLKLLQCYMFIPYTYAFYLVQIHLEIEALGKLCTRYKDEFDAIVQNNVKKVNFSDKRKKDTKTVSREGYVTKAVRGFYPDLKKSKHDDPSLKKATKLGKRCLDQAIKGWIGGIGTSSEKQVSAICFFCCCFLCIFVQGRWQPTQRQLIQIYSVDWTDVYDTHNIEHRAIWWWKQKGYHP